jgi:nitroimidazol reductase NimA-like FMN-containing flavoprotein (pyridoxamine 5'-phosphate oxidase superfamily)
MPIPVTETEVNNFLESKLNIQIATIDEEGYPVIHPTWFVYNKNLANYIQAPKK